MSRRLLGYVVKLHDGTRHTEGPLSLLDAVSVSHGSVPPTHVTPVFAVRKPRPVVVPPLAQAMAIASIVDEPDHLDHLSAQVAAYAKPAPVVAAEAPKYDLKKWADEIRAMAAPAEDADGWHACLRTSEDGRKFFRNLTEGERGLQLGDVGTHEQAVSAVLRRPGAWEADIVRVLPFGAHEAAVAAARREGAGAARLDALLSLRDACEFKADTVSDEAAMGLRMAMVLVDRALTKTAEEAAKGQAK